MPELIKGRAHVYGDNVDTDCIIAGKYTKTLDMEFLSKHVMEDLDPDFLNNMREGDLVVGGANFGCGSSREQAPLALKAAGVSAVIATYFARIFFRNAINIGLPVFEVGNLDIDSGDELVLNIKKGTLQNRSKETLYDVDRLPIVMTDILEMGGLVNYLKSNGTYRT